MIRNYVESDRVVSTPVLNMDEVSVKNTFIHVGANFASPRRNASTPPSLRNAPTRIAVFAPMDPDDGIASTDSEVMDAKGSPRSATTGSPLDSGSIATGSPCYTPRSSPGLPYAAEWPPGVDSIPPLMVMLPPEVMLPPPVEAPAVGPPRLKSSAMPYQPRVVLPGGPNTPQNIHLARAEAIMRVATAAITALMAHPAVQGAVRVLEDHAGWTCQVEVLHSGAHALNEVLECAKANLLEAAGSSNDIYVMGYEAAPFQNKPDGFEATLGVMQDESQACWDSYTSGSCCRGVRCRWQHPTCLKRFAVTAWNNQNT